MNYNYILDFYNKNKDLLIYGELRPVKSITRNIFTGILPFISYYRYNGKTSYTEKEIARIILKLNCDSSTTSKDNIRNMQELKFMSSIDSKQEYHLTRRFVSFCNSGLTIREYILQTLSEISNINDITMFFNCILCTLIDGLLNGNIILYPESYDEFKTNVSDQQKRIELCKKVYRIYGFKGRNNVPFGSYTPNANYRIISTCVSLKLIEQNGENVHHFKQFIITKSGFKLLDQINNNIKNYK